MHQSYFECSILIMKVIYLFVSKIEIEMLQRYNNTVTKTPLIHLDKTSKLIFIFSSTNCFSFFFRNVHAIFCIWKDLRE